MFRECKMQERTTIKEGIWANDRSVRFEWRNRTRWQRESDESFNREFKKVQSLGKGEKKYYSIYQLY